ncbi:MAG: methionine--tRNA ligase subunit beta, partial [Clostridia bacterium]|nr:methionine--tRNA ligase subunit beta [Clostridia bacterium]
FKVIQRANKYIDECAPWILAKSEEGKVRLKTVLYNLCETIRMSAVILQPFLTETPAKIFGKLGIVGEELTSFKSLEKFGAKISGLKVEKGEQLFQRIDIEKELKIMDEILDEQKKLAQKQKKEETKVENVIDIQEITIDDFAKISLKVGKVVECQKVEKADKLLCSKIDLGEAAPRTIVSGIAKYYSPEEMVGKQVIVVTNLKPVKLRGIESQGMVLCASDEEGNLALISPEKSMKSGSEVR